MAAIQKSQESGPHPMVDLNDIALFVQVVGAGSFAAAARRLGMPPNTVSRRIQALEEQLGVRLLQRSTRQLTLTPAGATLHEHSARQVQALAEAAREASEGGKSVSGKVRVAAPADLFRWFELGWVADFLADHPKVHLEFHLSDAPVDLIEQGIDVALRAAVDTDSSLVARLVGTARSVLVAAPAYIAEHGQPASLAELTTHQCLVMPGNARRNTWRLVGPQGMEEVEVGGRFQANTKGVLLDATLAGLGIGLLPLMIAAQYIREGRLVEVLPDFGTENSGVYLAYPSRRQLPRAVRAFIDFATVKLVKSGLVDPVA
jgi:LysR family transcriptional regulator AphB